MPKTKFQEVIFTLLMVSVMVYAMICYNISLNIGNMTNQVFLLAFNEMLIMAPIAFMFEMFLVEKLSKFFAFQIVKPHDHPFFILLSISSMIVCFMCPIMSLIATLLFKGSENEIFAVWIQTTILNFPMAFCWQIFIAGPLVRFIFRTMFKNSLNK